MLVEVGTTIDLRYLNKKSEKVIQKKSFSQTVEQQVAFTGGLVEVGTQFVRNKITGTWDKRIPVAFA